MTTTQISRPPAALADAGDIPVVRARRHAEADEGWTFPWHASNGGC